MHKITVTYPDGSYPICLGQNVLSALGPRLTEAGFQGRCVLVSNETVGPLHAETALNSLKQAGFDPTYIEIPDGEQHKTLRTIATLYEQFIAAKLDRSNPVLALGGGVVGDAVGFAAASYLRGVPFVQIPTTLLAMVDASVGGKTGVDLPQGKNLVGAFKQPELVIIDPEVLKTLPLIEIRAGLAEVIKHGIIDDPDLFAKLEAWGHVETSAAYTELLSAELLAQAVGVKVRVVQADPFERGRRAVLNLGHTFAHAFERLAQFEMRHGEAVAIGLVCAAEVAVQRGHCQPKTVERIRRLVQQSDLPTAVPSFPAEAIWQAMFTDKKRLGDSLRFILPRAIGDVDIFSEVPQAVVINVLSKLQQRE